MAVELHRIYLARYRDRRTRQYTRHGCLWYYRDKGETRWKVARIAFLESKNLLKTAVGDARFAKLLKLDDSSFS